MYLKLSSFLLLIGLISQIIAAPNQKSDFTESTISDRNIMSSSFASTKKELNFVDDIENITDSIETIKKIKKDFIDSYNPEQFGGMMVFMDKCIERDGLSIFDTKNINAMATGSLDLDGVYDLTLDEIQLRVTAIFTNITNKLSNKDELADEIDHATENLVAIIASSSRSNVDEVMRIIDNASKLFAPQIHASVKKFPKLFESMNIQIITAAVMRQEPVLSSYLLDLVTVIKNQIKHEKPENFYKTVSSLLQQKNFGNFTSHEDIETIKILNELFDQLVNEIQFVSDMNINSNENYKYDYENDKDIKFETVVCLTENVVIKVFAEILMTKLEKASNS